MAKTINQLVIEAHETAKEKGWYDQPTTFGDQIANMHAELSEAWEDFRNGKEMKVIQLDLSSDRVKPLGIPIELADVVIRIFDTCGYYGINLEEAIKVKLEYNKTRPYKHGKTI
jgi:NTP pyrophosphatase (non-canonical NTP hydrolase)